MHSHFFAKQWHCFMNGSPDMKEQQRHLADR